MKVWMFYLIDKKLIKRYIQECLIDVNKLKSQSDNWLFYSYTDKKKIAKLFKKTRNMEVFHMKELDITEDEFEELDDIFHGFTNLILSSLKSDDNDSVQVPVTSTEQWICVENSQETLFNYINAYMMFDWRVLSEKMREVMWKLGFMFYDTSAERCHDLEIMEEKYGDSPYIKVKEPFNLFLYLYKDILDKKGLLEVITSGKK